MTLAFVFLTVSVASRISTRENETEQTDSPRFIRLGGRRFLPRTNLLSGSGFLFMEIIKHLPRRLESWGDTTPWALFHCAHCGSQAERRYFLGIKQKSCGCIRTKHSDCKSKLYRVWASMLNRCRDTKNKYYGGRGIQVCAAWHDYATFKAWAESNGYKEGLFIDREKQDGHYCPENCRWVTPLVSGENRSTTKIPLVEVPLVISMSRRMTHETVAGAFGVAPNTVSGIVRGDRRVAGGRKKKI